MGRGRITAGIGLAAAGGVGVLGVGLLSWAAAIARTVVTPPGRRYEDVRILGVTPGTITLEATLDAVVPGDYSFWFAQNDGHARVGEILHRAPGAVTRRLLGVDFGELHRAKRGRISGWLYLTPRELGVDFEDVTVDTEVGPAPAWLVPGGDGRDWVIQVHGRAVRRAEGLRAVPVFREAGYTSLLISYRNDGDAPRSADARYALGDTEWRDVEAAIRFALDRGAERVVLMGWSMGGATVLQTVSRSALARVVPGIVLESPVIDWVTALRFQARLLRLPWPIPGLVLGILGSRWGAPLAGRREPIDLARLDFVTRAAELRLPTLVLHSDDDGFIPVTASEQLADARPELVTFERFAVGRHTKLWNYDPERWEGAVRDWLSRLDASTGSTDTPRHRRAAR